MEFMVQFVHFFPGFFEGALSRGSDFIEPATPALHAIKRRPEQAGSLQAVQERIKGTRADAIAVMFQLLHHRETKDGLVHCVQQYMDADQPVEELPFLIGHVNNIPPRIATVLTIIETRYNFGSRWLPQLEFFPNLLKDR